MRDSRDLDCPGSVVEEVSRCFLFLEGEGVVFHEGAGWGVGEEERERLVGA